jgi:gluconolactonase
VTTGLVVDAFLAADGGFAAVTGARPSLSVLARCDAHEGPTYLPGEDARYVTTVPTGRPPTAQIKRLALDGDRVRLGPGSVTVVAGSPVMPNGMTRWGSRLLVCDQGDLDHPAQLSLVAPDTGATTTVLQSVDRRPLTSPNDVVLRRDGTVWFTDPSYGRLQRFRPAPALPDAVYRLDPAAGHVRAVAEDLDKPNGLAFAPDETLLYVTDSGAVQEPGSYRRDRPHHVYAYDVVDGGDLDNRRIVDETAPGTPDGIVIDEDGRVYVCCADGVRVLTREGTLLGRIAVPGAVNLTFGGRDRDRLFITARAHPSGG